MNQKTKQKKSEHIRWAKDVSLRIQVIELLSLGPLKLLTQDSNQCVRTSTT